MTVNIKIAFKGGIGQVDVKVKRDGNLVGNGTTNNSATPIILNHILSGDTLVFEGVSAPGGSNVAIDVSTTPAIHFFTAGSIHKACIVL